MKMKKGGLIIEVLSIVLVICYFSSCASVKTVKFSPDLTKENAATLVLTHKIYRGEYIGAPTASIEIASIDGTSVKWNRDMEILIPPGRHELRVKLSLTMISPTRGWAEMATISIVAGKGE
jgi:hypothetical protein